MNTYNQWLTSLCRDADGVYNHGASNARGVSKSWAGHLNMWAAYLEEDKHKLAPEIRVLSVVAHQVVDRLDVLCVARGRSDLRCDMEDCGPVRSVRLMTLSVMYGLLGLDEVPARSLRMITSHLCHLLWAEDGESVWGGSYYRAEEDMYELDWDLTDPWADLEPMEPEHEYRFHIPTLGGSQGYYERGVDMEDAEKKLRERDSFLSGRGLRGELWRPDPRCKYVSRT